MNHHVDIDDLIIAFLNGDASDEDERRLLEWRRASAANEARFVELRRMWTVTEAARPRPSRSQAPDAEALTRRAELAERDADVVPIAAGRNQPSEADRPRTTAPSWQSGLLKAAAVAAVLVPLGYGLAVLQGPGTAPIAMQYGELHTGAGERATLTLPDQSTVRLGPQSRLRVTEDADGVVAHLEGRAFFGVETDTTRSWTVRTPDGEAVVLGTRFEVRAEQDEFRVMVVQGRVEVRSGAAQAQLNVGQMSSVRPGADLAVTQVADVYQHLDWLGNALVFQSTALPTVLQEIEHRYGVEFELASPELAPFTVTATFTDQPVEQVVLVVCGLLRAQCTDQNGRIRVESRRPGDTP